MLFLKLLYEIFINYIVLSIFKPLPESASLIAHLSLLLSDGHIFIFEKFRKFGFLRRLTKMSVIFVFVARCKWGAERRKKKKDGVSNYYIVLDVSYLVGNRTEVAADGRAIPLVQGPIKYYQVFAQIVFIEYVGKVLTHIFKIT